MPMNSSLTSALSEFSKGRRGPLEPSSEPPLHPTELNRLTRWWPDKLVPFAFARFLMIFFIGVAATLAWQAYGGAARDAIASWSPRLGWLAPATPPAGSSSDRIKATSLALAAVRQSIDKLAIEIGKLQATDQGAPDRISAPPPSQVGVPARKPVAPPQPSRAPPVR
jgi:hypothetical protein